MQAKTPLLADLVSKRSESNWALIGRAAVSESERTDRSSVRGGKHVGRLVVRAVKHDAWLIGAESQAKDRIQVASSIRRDGWTCQRRGPCSQPWRH